MTTKPMSDAELKKQFELQRLDEYARLFGESARILEEATKLDGKIRSDKLGELPKVCIWDKATDIALDNLIASAKASGKEEVFTEIEKMTSSRRLKSAVSSDNALNSNGTAY